MDNYAGTPLPPAAVFLVPARKAASVAPNIIFPYLNKTTAAARENRSGRFGVVAPGEVLRLSKDYPFSFERFKGNVSKEEVFLPCKKWEKVIYYLVAYERKVYDL